MNRIVRGPAAKSRLQCRRLCVGEQAGKNRLERRGSFESLKVETSTILLAM